MKIIFKKERISGRIRVRKGACLPKMAMENFISKYHLYAEAQGLSSKTISHTSRCVRFFDTFMGGIQDVSQVTADDLRRFIVALRQKPVISGKKEQSGKHLSGTSINTYVRAIKSFWNWLLANNIITVNPLNDVATPKKPKKLPKIISDNELDQIMKYIKSTDDDRLYAMFYLFLDTGIRLSELAGIKINDINHNNRSLIVYGKGEKQRQVYLDKECELAISRYEIFLRPEPKHEDILFLSRDGYPLTPNRIQKTLELAGKKAGLKQRLSAHKLRHTYATLSLKNGGNLEYIRRTLGHNDIKTTQIYLELSDSDIEEAHNRFSPLSNLQKKINGMKSGK